MHVMIWKRCNIQFTFRVITDLSRNRSTSRKSTLLLNDDISRLRFSGLNSTLSYRNMASASGSKDVTKHQNKLAYEKSSYLLQHANNPVNWYPWGEEALEAAKRENKVIFLSVGYSTCHWCHVMEKESFENPEIAQIMNEHFINIKVDREERPDIDRVYMNFIQSISGHGGWPMSVFLTPDLAPITGGTYFPPEDKYGTPGFGRVLRSVAEKWADSKDSILESSKKILNVLKMSADSEQKDQDKEVPPVICANGCVQQLTHRYEKKFGGFAKIPKFPQPVYFNLLFLMHARDPTGEIGKNCLHMCVHTLTKMANGGIHDHVGQGFARYSVDDKWHVPHFEKMLYDQGQLLRSFCEAYQATKNSFFAEVSDDIVKYVIRDLRHPDGGFYSAEDADSYAEHGASEKHEGAFYVWEYSEITNHLDNVIDKKKNLKLSDIFCYHFNAKQEGNVSLASDPHGELEKKNVLIVYESITKTAEHFKMPEEKVKSYLKEALDILFQERCKRPRPHLDDKFITAWNGLMISGLSYAASTLKNVKYAEYAEDAAKFIERYLFDEKNKTLFRSCYRNDNNQIQQTSVPIKGFQADYAFVIQALIDLYEVNFNSHWLELAEILQDIQDSLFWDNENGGYYSTTLEDSSVILRLKDDQDGAEPSGNSVACRNLIRLSVYLDRQELSEKASLILASMKQYLEEFPIVCPELVTALVNYHDSLIQIYIVGSKDAEDTKQLLEIVRDLLIPGKILVVTNESDSETILHRKNAIIKKMKCQNGRATAYVCKNRVCSLPVTEPSQLAQLLTSRET